MTNQRYPDDVVRAVREDHARTGDRSPALSQRWGMSRKTILRMLRYQRPYDVGHGEAKLRFAKEQSLRRVKSCVGNYICRNPEPLVRQLYGIINRQKLLIAWISERAGYGRDTIYNWGKTRKSPTVTALQDTLNSIGYRLIIVRADPDEAMTHDEMLIYQRGYRAGFMAGHRSEPSEAPPDEDAA